MGNICMSEESEEPPLQRKLPANIKLGWLKIFQDEQLFTLRPDETILFFSHNSKKDFTSVGPNKLCFRNCIIVTNIRILKRELDEQDSGEDDKDNGESPRAPRAMKNCTTIYFKDVKSVEYLENGVFSWDKLKFDFLPGRGNPPGGFDTMGIADQTVCKFYFNICKNLIEAAQKAETLAAEARQRVTRKPTH